MKLGLQKGMEEMVMSKSFRNIVWLQLSETTSLMFFKDWFA